MQLDDYRLDGRTVEKWLERLYELSEANTLENALSVSKMLAENDEDQELCSTITLLLRAEKSGDINPPIKMRVFYKRIVEKNTYTIEEKAC